MVMEVGFAVCSVGYSAMTCNALNEREATSLFGPAGPGSPDWKSEGGF
jgi:hypothetical protein